LGLKCEKPVRKITVKKVKETEGLKTTTVKLDEEQMHFIAELLYDMRDSIEDISVEPQTQSSDEADLHAPSIIMRSVLATFFCMISVALVYGLVVSWHVVVAKNSLLTAILMAIFLGIIAISSIVIGLSIGKESSKTYIVSLFSAVVALVALVVAFIK